MKRGTDVDFGQGGGPEIRLPLVLPVSKALLWINGGVFLLTLAQGKLIEWFALSPSRWAEGFPLVPLWQLLTYGFLHSRDDPFHLLYNLLGIYFFGSMLEGIVGSRRYLAWYLAAIVFGGIVQLVDGLLAVADGPVGYTLGASGGVLFLIVACATLRPRALVIFILFPMQLKTLALILVGIDVFRLVSPSSGTAYLVHLAGAAMGFGAAKLGWIWIDPIEKLEEQRAAAVQRGAEDDARRLDQLLAQIHQRGIGSLSKSERDFLKRMSSRK
jgi:membrane associated rhomboid family serine protease